MHTIPTAGAIYDEIASWYHRQLQQSWIHQTAIPALLEEVQQSRSVRGHHICDLRCGTGIFTRELAKQGAFVTGIDISSELLACAREREQTDPLGITYLEADAQQRFWAGEPFDGVTSNLALIDIPDLAQVAGTVAHLLGPGAHGFSLPYTLAVLIAQERTALSTTIIPRRATGARITRQAFVVGLAATIVASLPISRSSHKWA